jgi:hypothetical protein
MTEYASNAATSAFTDISLFMINFGLESRMNIDSIDCIETARERLAKKNNRSTQLITYSTSVNLLEIGSLKLKKPKNVMQIENAKTHQNMK